MPWLHISHIAVNLQIKPLYQIKQWKANLGQLTGMPWIVTFRASPWWMLGGIPQTVMLKLIRDADGSIDIMRYHVVFTDQSALFVALSLVTRGTIRKGPTWSFPLNTWRNNNVVITSKRRHWRNYVKMMFWRNNDVIIAQCVCWVAMAQSFDNDQSQHTRGVIRTSLIRQNDVRTFWRNNDVINMPCDCWGVDLRSLAINNLLSAYHKIKKPSIDMSVSSCSGWPCVIRCQCIGGLGQENNFLNINI